MLNNSQLIFQDMKQICINNLNDPQYRIYNDVGNCIGISYMPWLFNGFVSNWCATITLLSNPTINQYDFGVIYGILRSMTEQYSDMINLYVYSKNGKGIDYTCFMECVYKYHDNPGSCPQLDYVKQNFTNNNKEPVRKRRYNLTYNNNKFLKEILPPQLKRYVDYNNILIINDKLFGNRLHNSPNAMPQDLNAMYTEVLSNISIMAYVSYYIFNNYFNNTSYNYNLLNTLAKMADFGMKNVIK